MERDAFTQLHVMLIQRLRKEKGITTHQVYQLADTVLDGAMEMIRSHRVMGHINAIWSLSEKVILGYDFQSAQAIYDLNEDDIKLQIRILEDTAYLGCPDTQRFYNLRPSPAKRKFHTL